MNEHQRYAFAHPCPTANGLVLGEPFFRRLQRGKRFWAVALSVNR